MVLEYRIGDCLELMKELPDNSVNLVIADPPYNVLGVEWDKDEIDWKKLAGEFKRIIKPCGNMFIFGQTPMIFNVFKEFSACFVFKQDLIWYKNRGFSMANTIFTKHHENILFFTNDNRDKLIEFGNYIKQARIKRGMSLRDVGELCGEKWYHRGGHLYFETGLSCPTEAQYNRLLSVLGIDDVFQCLFDRPTFNFEDIKTEGKPYTIKREGQKIYGIKSNLGKHKCINDGKRNPKTVLEYPVIQSGDEYVGHPTQKPLELIKYLIYACSNEGDLVLDPFLGSGTTLRACRETNRSCIGFEKEPKYEAIIRKRAMLDTPNLQTFLTENKECVNNA